MPCVGVLDHRKLKSPRSSRQDFSSFGCDGMVTTSDGKLVMVNALNDGFALARFTTGGTQRLYVQHDANYSTMGLLSREGNLVEEYGYSPYGEVTVRQAGTNREFLFSNFEWQYLHQGGRQDPISGLYHFRHRDYAPSLGRWMQQDPAGYVDGMSLYGYVASALYRPLGAHHHD